MRLRFTIRDLMWLTLVVTLHSLTELSLAHYESPEWTLTAVGWKLLPALMDGDELPQLG